MPQNLTSNSKIVDPSLEEMLDETIPVDNHADRLIDEVFQEVERVLEGGNALPTEPLKPDYVALNPIQVPQVVLPPSILGQVEIAQKTEEAIRLAELRAEKRAASRSFDRILLGAAFASLMITLGLWLATRGGLGRLLGPVPVKESLPATQAQPVNQGFVTYIEQALSRIDQREAAQTTQRALPGTPGIPGAAVVTALPTIGIPGTPPQTGNLAQAINRVADLIEEQNAKPAPTIPAPQVVVIPPAPVPAPNPVAINPVAINTTPPQQTGVTIPPVASAPRTFVPVEPEETVRDTSNEESSETVAVAPQPATIYSLVGVLELGERSVALFEVDGVTRRVKIGESIGASGWTLVEVANQEAVVRRNGEVRSIFVGQGF